MNQAYYILYKNVCSFVAFRTKEKVDIMSYDAFKGKISKDKNILISVKSIIVYINFDHEFGIYNFRVLCEKLISNTPNIKDKEVLFIIADDPSVIKYTEQLKPFTDLQHAYVFEYRAFTFDITERQDSTKYKILTNEEIKDLREFFCDGSWEKNIPKISSSDIGIRWYGAKPGDVVMSKSTSINSTQCISYLRVD